VEGKMGVSMGRQMKLLTMDQAATLFEDKLDPELEKK